MPLTCFLTRKRPYLFCLFFSELQPFFSWFCGIGLALINKMNCTEVFVSFVRSVSHVIISTQKYILTRVSGHDKRVTWPYIFRYYHRSKIKQKLREKLKHQGLSGIFQIPPSLPPTRTLFPLSVCLDSIVDSPSILYLSKVNLQNQLFKDISRSNTNKTKTFTKFHI